MIDRGGARRRGGAAAIAAVACATLAGGAHAAAAPPYPAHVRALHVATTTRDLAALAREVGGSRVRTAVIGRAVGPDSMAPLRVAVAALADADILVEVGVGFEPRSLETTLAAARNPRLIPNQPSFVDASARILVLERPDSARATPAPHALGNPHYLLDPLNAVAVARELRDAFITEDPDSADAHRRRCAEFETRVAEAAARWGDRGRAMGLTGLEVVTYHRTWSYFARAFGLEVVDAVEPAPGRRPDAGRVAQVVQTIRARRVGLLLASAADDTILCARIAREAGVPLAIAPASLDEAAGATSEFELFDRIFDSLAAALGTGRRR